MGRTLKPRYVPSTRVSPEGQTLVRLSWLPEYRHQPEMASYVPLNGGHAKVELKWERVAAHTHDVGKESEE